MNYYEIDFILFNAFMSKAQSDWIWIGPYFQKSWICEFRK